MIQAADGVKTTIVPIFEAVAPAGGPLTRDASELLIGEFSQRLNDETDSVDALILVLSGCTLNDEGISIDDAILRVARTQLRPGCPIVAIWSNLANLSAGMVAQTDASVSYDLRGAEDAKSAGLRAFDLIRRMVLQEIDPQSEFRTLPLLLPPGAWRADREPLRPIQELAGEFEALDRVLGVSICSGFPYADHTHAGVSLVVTTNADPELASSLATRLRTAIWTNRDAFFAAPANVETAVHEAMPATAHPVVIADAGDDPALGAASEGTGMLWALIDLGAQNAAFATIVDPAAVESAIRAGAGSTITLDLGGKFDRSAGYPINVTGRVRRILDASEAGLGRVVRLDVEGRHSGSVEVIVSERPQEPSRAMFEALGIDLAAKQIVAVKSSWRVRENFGNLAASILETTTPGITTPVLAFFDYQRIPRPIYPLDAL